MEFLFFLFFLLSYSLYLQFPVKKQNLNQMGTAVIFVMGSVASSLCSLRNSVHKVLLENWNVFWNIVLVLGMGGGKKNLYYKVQERWGLIDEWIIP